MSLTRVFSPLLRPLSEPRRPISDVRWGFRTVGRARFRPGSDLGRDLGGARMRPYAPRFRAIPGRIVKERRPLDPFPKRLSSLVSTKGLSSVVPAKGVSLPNLRHAVSAACARIVCFMPFVLSAVPSPVLATFLVSTKGLSYFVPAKCLSSVVPAKGVSLPPCATP